MSCLQPLLWPGDSLTVQRDPPLPGLTLVELLLVSTVWGRQWYFVALELIGRRRREEEHTKAEGEEAGNTSDNVDCFPASFNDYFEWLRNYTRSLTKAEYMFQCIIIWLYCSHKDNYHNLKKPQIINLCSVCSVLFLHYSYFMHHKVLSTTGIGNYLFYIVVVLFCINLYMLSMHISQEQFTAEDQNISDQILMHIQPANAVPGGSGCQDLTQSTAFHSTSGNLSSDPCGHFMEQSPKFQAL